MNFGKKILQILFPFINEFFISELVEHFEEVYRGLLTESMTTAESVGSPRGVTVRRGRRTLLRIRPFAERAAE